MSTPKLKYIYQKIYIILYNKVYKKLFLSGMFKNCPNNTNKGKKLDIGFNIIKNKDLINDPPNNSFRTNIFFITNEALLEKMIEN